MHRRLTALWLEIRPPARTVLLCSSALTILCCLGGLFSLQLAPEAVNFSGTMSMAAGYFEAAPGCFAAGIAAAVIIDLVTRADLE